MSNHLSMSNQQVIIGLIERGWSQHRVAGELALDRKTSAAARPSEPGRKVFPFDRGVGGAKLPHFGRRLRLGDLLPSSASSRPLH